MISLYYFYFHLFTLRILHYAGQLNVCLHWHNVICVMPSLCHIAHSSVASTTSDMCLFLCYCFVLWYWWGYNINIVSCSEWFLCKPCMFQVPMTTGSRSGTCVARTAFYPWTMAPLLNVSKYFLLVEFAYQQVRHAPS